MKYVIVALFMMASTAQAKEYNFTFRFDGATLKYKTNQPTFEDAFKLAADICFKKFSERMSKFDEEKSLELIDVCVNPPWDK